MDTKYKPTAIQLQNFKKDPNIQNIVAKLPQDKQDLYLSYRYAAQKIVDEAKLPENKNTISQENYDFIRNFNKLDTELDL